MIVPTTLPNGRVEVTIAHAYTLGQASTIPIFIQTTRGTESAVVAAGQTRTTAVSWDGRDEKGELVPGDAYLLVVEFQIDDRRAGVEG